MLRVPEPELMDDEAQALAYALADFAEPHQWFVELMCERFPELAVGEGRMLDLGCGPADVTVRVARAHPRARIDGIDGSEAMLRRGRERIDREALAGRVRLYRRYLPEEALGPSEYDAIVSNSLLHHLKEPSVLWRTARARARSGAPIFVMDLARPDSRARAAELVHRYAEGAPDVLRHDFHASLLAAYTPSDVWRQLAAVGLATFDVQAVSDRHWIAWGRCP